MSELRNPERELYLFRRRLALAGGVVVFAFLVLLGRFVFLQVAMQSHYATLAESNRISLVPAVPNRGVITDRNGVVLAQSFSAYTLEVTPSKVRNLEETIEELATLVEITARDRKRFRKLLEESKNFESMPLRTRLTDEEVARFAVNRYRFPGVEVKARLFRQYPFGELASHVIGYIGRINDADVERIEVRNETANYKGSDYIGKVGIELSYESELHGTTGLEEVEVDAGGRAVRLVSRTPPISGNNLQLSLDIKLQQVAEAAFGDKRGALVALDPATGEVLAFVSKPGYDPNLFVEGIDPQNWDALNTSPDKPLLNRPLRGAYPPGSTFKPFMALAALKLGKRTPQQTINDPGYFVLSGGHRFNDDKKGGHGSVDMYKSIVVSCDTYYYQLASELEIDDLAGVMKLFGFGQKSGIDIEGELSGVLPSREWKRQRFAGKQYRDEHRKWYLGDNISVGIGQGYNAYTPLQLAHAISTVATNGVAYKPHLVKSIHSTRTGSVTMVDTTPSHTIAMKPEHWETVKAALVGVNKEGTGARAFAGAAYTNGGKTGTAQVYSLRGEKYDAKRIGERLRDHALFIAYAPAEQPRIALSVLVENGGFGAAAAAPIARQVMDYFLTGKIAKPTAPTLPPPVDDESD
ncbi:MAG: penicillin-binding protein 2 [Betaproteobacteria bacterium]|nr:penicillin-binding protein 2 [Betaproteobacteria bacterium]